MNKVGASQIDITPTCEVYLAGTAELRKTVKVQSRLYASVLVVDDGKIRFVFISLDLLWLDDALCSEVRERVAKVTKTISDHVMVSCTHTHNGPSICKTFPLIPPDEEVVCEIKNKIVEAAKTAVSQLVKANMFQAKTTIARSFNRRVIIETGKVWINAGAHDPAIVGAEGPADQELLALWFKDGNNDPIAVLVNYSAHPNHWCFENIITADFPGEVCSTIQSGLDDKVPVLYLQGGCGNTDIKDFAKYQYAKDYDWLEDTKNAGHEIGNKVLELINDTSNTSGTEITLSHQKRVFEAPARHIGREDMPLADASEFLSTCAPKPQTICQGYEPEAWKQYWAESVVQLEGAKPFRETYPFETSLYRLGELVIVTNPAEMFVEYQLEVKKQSPFAYTMVAELTNGYCGYIPTETAMVNGGYESRLALSSFLSPEAGAMWVKIAVNILSN